MKTFRLFVSVSAAAMTMSGIAQAQLVPQTAPGNPPSIEGQTQVPANSDSAEEEQARQAAAAKAAEDGTATGDQTTSDGKAPADAERVRIDNIRKLREDGAKTAKPGPDGEVTVTGSRLKQGDVTTRLTVIDKEEIRQRGVTSVEDLIRTLPQNLATIGAITNDRSRGPLRPLNRPNGGPSSVGSLGVSAANLGGVGAGNTLILVNGRRIAGAAGIEQGYANLNGIPISAIERVEISTGGSSAIYGADALGGVINFILKSGYVGNTATFQHEFSSGGADSTRVSLYSGYGWGSGNIAVSLDFSDRKPIVNRKTGYVTRNYAPMFGGDSYYDRRDFNSGTQPGVTTYSVPVFDPVLGFNRFVDKGLTLPAGYTGKPRRQDFIEVGTSYARDFIPEEAGPGSKSASTTMTLSQKITDRLTFTLDGLYTRTKNTQTDTNYTGLPVSLAPGQYYNPFAAYELNSFSPGVLVKYFPQAELADGVLPPGTVRNLAKSWNVTAGLSYRLTNALKVDLLYTRSAATTSGDDKTLQSLVTNIIPDPSRPGSYTCSNNDLARNAVPASRLAEYQALLARQCAALTSSDPNIAFNPWKSTTNGGGSSVTNFLFRPILEDRDTKFQNVEGRVTGTALRLPAGPVAFALGGEYARNTVGSDEIAKTTGTPNTTDRYAFFGEATVPILGRGHTLPLIRELTINAAARYDNYSTSGAVGTVDNVLLDQGGKIIYATNRFGNWTPAWGVMWAPVNSLVLRARWSRGFKAPPPTSLFNPIGTQTYTTIIYGDPLYTCTTDCVRGQQAYVVPLTIGPNPNLKPQTSHQEVYSASWQPSGFLSGLSLAVTYNRNRLFNEFAQLSDLYAFQNITDIYRNPYFFPRTSTGKIASQQNTTFNIVGSTYESLTFEGSYILDTGIGTFQPKLVYLDNLKAERIGYNNTSRISTLGTILGPDRYKIVGSMAWNKGPYSATVFAYYTPSYINDYATFYSSGTLIGTDRIQTVKSLTTIDMTLSWVASKALSFDVSGRNIFKAGPPFALVDSLPYDTARYNVAGRTLLLRAQVTF